MKRIIFESAPEYVIICLVIALGYAALQYYKPKQQPWSKKTNGLLFLLRSTLTFQLLFLLLGPIIKQINNIYEKPLFVVLADNSLSIDEATDSARLKTTTQEIFKTKELLDERGYESSIYDLAGESTDNIVFENEASDIHGALKKITNRFEGQRIAGVLLVSDGIFNSGLSPLYGTYNFPVHTIGIGDTTQRMDLSIKNLAYNKIAYQGNKFPLRVEVQTKNIGQQNISVTLSRKGQVLEAKTLRSDSDGLLTFEFQPLASEQGLQKLDVQVAVKDGEQNVRNNRGSVFVEVVEGKKKILLVAAAPHPDIKALREVVEKNSNYEFLLHIPGIKELPQASMKPEIIDLAIFHQSPDVKGRTTALFRSFVNSKSSLMIVLGQQSDIANLERLKAPVDFEGLPRDFDEVTPLVNANFPSFNMSTDANTLLAEFPPVYVHFGKVQLPQTSTALLYQQIGNVGTEKPLLSVNVTDSRKTAILFGEGVWRWRLHEYERTENTAAFDELFGKLIQFLSTTEDKRKFRSYPLKQEFSETEPVVFESQVYNDIYEPIFGNKIEIIITDESGRRAEYSYVTSPGNIRYQIGGLSEGVYRYKSRTSINNKVEEVNGEFAVIEQQAERQNLTADFDLLRKLSSNTGGRFFTASAFPQLHQYLQQQQPKSIIHTEERYDSVINLTWVFWLFLLIVSVEWFLRKYHGSY